MRRCPQLSRRISLLSVLLALAAAACTDTSMPPGDAPDLSMLTCKSNGDCAMSPSGKVCADGFCVVCATSDDCPSGKRCDRRMACVDCLADGDCKTGEICSEKRICVMGCNNTSCPAGTGCCAGRCAPLNTTMDCGLCGNRCGAGTQCVGGACLCTTGLADCDGQAHSGCEVNIENDAMNCGACGAACPQVAHAKPACVAGACAVSCAAGRLDCDGLLGNGCEIDEEIDARNCGACGNVCPAGKRCAGGACIQDA